MNYEDKLTLLKKELDRAKDFKYKADARLEQLNNQKTEILKELEDYDIKPEDLESEISKLDNEIKELFEKASALLPQNPPYK